MRPLLFGLAWLFALGCSEDPTTWPFTLQSSGGPFEIRGTISLPVGVETSAPAALTLTNTATVSPFTTLAYVDEATIHDLGLLSGSVDYSITGLAPGGYLVGCLIDHDRDLVPSAGDLGGYYDGTSEAPLLHAGTAAIIEVTELSIVDADFGIGPVTCLARYGEACSEDTDCGGTICRYAATGAIRGLHAGSCDTESGTCREAPGECPLVEGEAGVKEESGCFGAGPE